jgi:hypothetical protein
MLNPYRMIGDHIYFILVLPCQFDDNKSKIICQHPYSLLEIPDFFLYLVNKLSGDLRSRGS